MATQNAIRVSVQPNLFKMINRHCMKHFFCSVLLLVLVNANAQQKPKGAFIVQGTMLNQQRGWVYLSYPDKEGKYIRDSAAIKNGTFQFKGFINEPTMAYFNGRMKSRSVDDPNYTTIYLEPTVMKIIVSENAFKEAKVSGSKTQRENEELQAKMNKVRDRWKEVLDTLSAVNKRSNFEFQELKNWVLRPYEAEIQEINRAFLRDHPTSYVSPFVLRSLAGALTTDSLTMYYDRFPDGLKNTVYGRSVREELERRKKGVPGTVAPNFTTTDINGNRLSLSDYKEKYVVLDFWASWCVPCRKGNPHLLELYAKYKDKGLEIIGVASDDGKEEAWKKAVEQDKTGVWKHVLSGYDQEKRMRGEKNENHIGEKYGIATLPTKILVDPKGVIIGRYGESREDIEAMDKKLSEVFGTL